MTLITMLALGFSLVLLVVHLTSIALVLPRLSRASVPVPTADFDPGQAPRITLLRPVHGLEHDLEATLASGLRLDYPNYQMLFCAEDADDPAADLVRRLIKAHPNADARLLIGRDQVSQNPKLNNLIKGWQVADGEWVAMADSNILLPPDYLSQLLALWDAQTGLVSSPAAGTAPDGWGGALECAFLDSYQARWQLAADQLGMGYGQGKTLFWQRSFLTDAGGPEVLAAEIAEDAAATKLVRKAGLKVRLTQRPFVQPVGRRPWQAVWGRQLRWAIIRRMGFPMLFLAEPLTGAALPLAAFAAATLGLGWPAGLIAIYAALWYGAEWALIRVAGWPGGVQNLAATVLRDAMIPALWLAAWRKSSFQWQGNQLGYRADVPAHGKDIMR
jgi:ceramide glucosyltransferase